jgi:hypothetical protein
MVIILKTYSGISELMNIYLGLTVTPAVQCIILQMQGGSMIEEITLPFKVIVGIGGLMEAGQKRV